VYFGATAVNTAALFDDGGYYRFHFRFRFLATRCNVVVNFGKRLAVESKKIWSARLRTSKRLWLCRPLALPSL